MFFLHIQGALDCKATDFNSFTYKLFSIWYDQIIFKIKLKIHEESILLKEV